MDDQRFGLAVRALRRRRGRTQLEVGQAAGISQSTVSRIERGHCQDLSVATLRRLLGCLDARLALSVAWRGGEIDRLLDERHAAAVSVQAVELQRRGWETALEVTFNHFGDRGSIDVLAWHPASRIGLVVEVKSEITSAEETLRRLDVKVRLARSLVAEQWGGRPVTVLPMLSVIDDSTNRRRIAHLATLFGIAFPIRGRAAARWLAAPTGAPRGILRFLSNINPGGVIRTPHRIRASRSRQPVPRRMPEMNGSVGSG